ncbi:MAG: sialidase family protein [Acidimicrobiales bacterium]
MTRIRDIEHRTVDRDENEKHCFNQASVRVLHNGDVVAVYNEERFPIHHDSGQTIFLRSSDGGESWGERTVVLPFDETTGNWDCGIAELADGTLLVNFTMAGYFKRGIKPEQPSWAREPMTEEWGDWTWSYRLMSWLGTYVVRSDDGGRTWSQPYPVNARPLKHAGCRVGCWPMPTGEILMGVYGRIHGYGEEGEGESTRATLLRSDDNGFNWEYFSTMAYDAASIIDYEEPAIATLADGRLVGIMRTQVNPSGDSKNMAVVVSDDQGFSWSAPRFTNIWGYPAEIVPLPDGRYVMVYGYRRPPYGVRGCVSEDGLHWDIANEFTIREGGVPIGHKRIDNANPGVFQHIGYPSAGLLPDGRILCLYHEWDTADRPLQYVLSTHFRVED